MADGDKFEAYELIDLREQRAEGAGDLDVAKFKRDGTSQEDGFIADLTFGWPIADEDGEVVDATCPGGRAQAERALALKREAAEAKAIEGASAASTAGAGKGRVTWTQRWPTVKLTLGHVKGDGGAAKVVLSDVPAEIVSVGVRASAKALRFEVKLRANVKANDSVGILLAMHRPVTVSLERLQQALPFDGPKPLTQIGDLVAGQKAGVEFCGLVKARTPAEDGGFLLELDDFRDEVLLVTEGDVESRFPVIPPEGKSIDAVTKGYVTKLKKAGKQPSWAPVIEEIGARVARNEAETEGDSYVISKELIDAALGSALASGAQDGANA